MIINKLGLSQASHGEAYINLYGSMIINKGWKIGNGNSIKVWKDN
jgi:hypothetical protein